MGACPARWNEQPRRVCNSGMNQIQCCVFDLETTNLNADFGVILCAVVKPANGEPIVFRGDSYANWKRRRSDDSKIVRDIVKTLLNYDIWCAHNGARFDVPFLRSRMLRAGMEPLPAKKLVDPVLLARSKLKLSYNSLEKVAEHLGCNSKTEVRPEMWLRASLDGSREAMNYIVEHCVQDVLVLEKVIGRLKEYSTNFNSWGSGF